MLRVVPRQDWRYPLYLLAEAMLYYEFAGRTSDGERSDHAITSLKAARSKVGNLWDFEAVPPISAFLQTGALDLFEEATTSTRMNR
jgi:hypothetical protein